MPCQTTEWARRKLAGDRRQVANTDVVRKIQKEAKAHGATLANGGKGGLDPRLALKVFRRDKWRCTNKNCPDPKKDLDLDHIGGHPKEVKEDTSTKDDPKLRQAAKMGHADKAAALHTLCRSCHDRVHDRERAIDKGKQPPPMRGE